MVKACPGVRPALALAVKPFEQNPCRTIDVVAAPLRVVRYGVIVQVPNYTAPGHSQHFTFSHYAARLYDPVCKLTQTGSQLLAAGATLQLEVSLPGLAAIMGKTQKSELPRFGPALPGAFSGKTTKLDAAGLILGHLKTKAFQPVLQSLTKCPRILLILKTGQKVSRPREPPPQSLSEPGVNLSAHRAPIIQPSVLCPSPSVGTARVAFGQFYPASVPLYVDGLLTS